MSWSVSAIGKAEPVAKELVIQFEQIKSYGMRQEETELAMLAAEVISKSLACNNYKGLVVKVEASGSYTVHPADGMYNNFNCIITPIWGFVE
jgi:hypothetical protein